MSFLDIPVFIISRLFTLLFRLIRIILFPFAKLITWTCGDYFVKLDKRHRITEDFYIIPTFFKYVFQYIWAVRTHRFQNWYIFIKQVKNQGDNLAIRYAKALPTKGDFELESYTYKELYAIVLRLSYILVNTYHVQPGQHIAIDCTNKPLFIFLWFSLWNIGAVPAFLNYNTMGKPLIHSLQISDIAQVFIDPEASIPISKSEEEIKNALPGLVLNYLDEKSLYETGMSRNDMVLFFFSKFVCYQRFKGIKKPIIYELVSVYLYICF